MADVYGPGLDAVKTFASFQKKRLDDSFELTRQIQTMDPNNPEHQKFMNEATNRIQEMRIAIDYAADVFSLILKLTQPVQ